LRYVEWNPVQAGLVNQAESWRWSSASAHATGHDARTLLDWTDWGQRWDPDRWKAALHEGVYGAAWADRLREATRTGRPAGDPGFVKSVEEILSRNLQPQKRGPKRHIQTASEQMNLEVV
jgi:putative transposase